MSPLIWTNKGEVHSFPPSLTSEDHKLLPSNDPIKIKPPLPHENITPQPQIAPPSEGNAPPLLRRSPRLRR